MSRLIWSESLFSDTRGTLAGLRAPIVRVVLKKNHGGPNENDFFGVSFV